MYLITKIPIKQISINLLLIYSQTLYQIYKLVTCDDKDPPWMNEFLKKIKWKKEILYRLC